jgi:WhiB family redox-sensing transcriptional regulator
MADTRRLPVPVTDIYDWQMRGACRGMDSALFFHPEGERGPALHEPYGVWGGLSEAERDVIVRRQDRSLRMLGPGDSLS